MKILLLLAVVSWAADAGSADPRGYLAMIEEVRAEMKALADDVGQRVVAAHKDVSEQIKQVGQATGGVASQLNGVAALVPPNDVPPQTAAKQAATGAVQGWRGSVQAAQAKQQAASAAHKELSAPGKLDAIDRKLEKIDEQLRFDRQVIDEGFGHRPGSTAADLAAYKGRADARLREADAANNESRADFDKQKARWTEFRRELESGSIKGFDQASQRLVQQAQQFLGRAESGVNAAQPGAGPTFSAAGAQVSSGASLAIGNPGHAAAKAAVDKPAAFAK